MNDSFNAINSHTYSQWSTVGGARQSLLVMHASKKEILLFNLLQKMKVDRQKR